MVIGCILSREKLLLLSEREFLSGKQPTQLLKQAHAPVLTSWSHFLITMPACMESYLYDEHFLFWTVSYIFISLTETLTWESHMPLNKARKKYFHFLLNNWGRKGRDWSVFHSSRYNLVLKIFIQIFEIFKSIFIYMNVCVGAQGGQKRASDSRTGATSDCTMKHGC